MPSFSSVLCALFPFLGFCLVWYRLRSLVRQVGRLEEISVYDPMTGLRSGRLFESECAILCRGPSPVAVLLAGAILAMLCVEWALLQRGRLS